MRVPKVMATAYASRTAQSSSRIAAKAVLRMFIGCSPGCRIAQMGKIAESRRGRRREQRRLSGSRSHEAIREKHFTRVAWMLFEGESRRGGDAGEVMASRFLERAHRARHHGHNGAAPAPRLPPNRSSGSLGSPTLMVLC